jgi:hypothetical protein
MQHLNRDSSSIFQHQQDPDNEFASQSIEERPFPLSRIQSKPSHGGALEAFDQARRSEEKHQGLAQ